MFHFFAAELISNKLHINEQTRTPVGECDRYGRIRIHFELSKSRVPLVRTSDFYISYLYMSSQKDHYSDSQ